MKVFPGHSKLALLRGLAPYLYFLNNWGDGYKTPMEWQMQATEFFFEAFRLGTCGTLQDDQTLGSPWGFRWEDIPMEILLYLTLERLIKVTAIRFVRNQ